MKLIGVKIGEYEGNKYAHILTSEPFRVDVLSKGLNVITSKCLYDLGVEIAGEWELYKDQDVRLYYNRYGKVEKVEVE